MRDNRALVLWDVAQRARMARFGGHGRPVRAVAFSSDGRRAVSGSEDRTAIVWDVERRGIEAVLLGHSTRLMGVSFLPGRSDVVSSDQDSTAILWNVEGRRPRLRFGHPRDGLNASVCLAVSPDGGWIANCRAAFRSETGESVATFDCDKWAMAFSPDGHSLAMSCGLNLELRDVHTWRPSESAPISDAIGNPVALSFSPDGQSLATGHDNGTVRLFAVNPLREVAVIGRHMARVKSVAFSPDGREVASAGDDKMIALWDVQRRQLIRKVGTHTAPVLAVAFSPDGRRLIAGGHDSSVRLYTRHRVRWGRRLD